MNKLTIGRLLVIYILFQISFIVLNCKGEIESNLLTFLPTIIISIIAVLLIALIVFLSKFYKYGKSKWSNH